MMSGIFGNKNAGRVLLHLFHYGEINATAVAKDYGVALSPIQSQLKRFEHSGIIVSHLSGRTRVYKFNPKSPFVTPVRKIVEIVYEAMPLTDREKIFSARRRPRARGKRVFRSLRCPVHL